jgi:hypothetical protein
MRILHWFTRYHAHRHSSAFPDTFERPQISFLKLKEIFGFRSLKYHRNHEEHPDTCDIPCGTRGPRSNQVSERNRDFFSNNRGSSSIRQEAILPVAGLWTGPVRWVRRQAAGFVTQICLPSMIVICPCPYQSIRNSALWVTVVNGSQSSG